MSATVRELEALVKRTPELFPPSPEALASWERLCRPKRKGHTLAEIEELKRRGQ